MRSQSSFLPVISRDAITRALSICLGVTCLLVAAATFSPAEAAIWTPQPGADAGERFPTETRVFSLDRTALEAALVGAPRERDAESTNEVSFPMPDGTWERFTVYTSGVMHPELAAKFPEIRPYRGLGRNSRWRARFELTPKGLEASIWTPDGRVQIEPVAGEGRYATAYLKDIVLSPAELMPLTCEFDPDPAAVHELEDLVNEMLRGGGLSNGENLSTYRLGVGATGEYTAQHGGTVPGGLAGIVATTNRVTEIMTQEWSVALELIPNNDLIIFTNPVTDPYSNGDTFAMLSQNQATLTSIIGAANYDQGHVFGTGGGGVAQLNVICRDNSKARGVSTSFNTSGEQFALLVAHEMGHQFGCNHSFNGDAGNCGPNRTGSAAYEPGSGSTIMAYAGICGNQNLQLTRDPYYHVHSYVQAVTNVTIGQASTCPVVTPTGNTPPVAQVGNLGHWVPLDTPFLIDGTATDADGDSLTYCWEEYDLGPAGHPDSPVGNAPIFRSWRPATVTFRYLPKLVRVLNNNHRLGEILPTYERSPIKMRITARDGLGGVHYDQGNLGADGTSGPFLVTSQATATTWDAGTQELITWDVANSDNGVVNCQTVNILMSEGGFEFPHVLASGVPNDGSEMITVPSVAATDARVMVQAADNIFFQINLGDITINVDATDVTLPGAAVAGLSLEPARPNPFAGTTSISYSVPAEGHASVRIYDAGGRLVRTLFDEVVSEGQHSVEWDGMGRTGNPVATGVYFVRLETERGSTGKQKVHLLR